MSIVPEVASRDELRAFLALHNRMDVDNIPLADVERQEDTVLRALAMLREQPGVVLADEVGMGKTFEALGVAAAFRHASRRGRIMVLTPGPDLNKKWFKEIQKFSARLEEGDDQRIYDFGDQVREANRLGDLLRHLRGGCRFVVAPVTIFNAAKGRDGQEYLLSLYFHWKQLHGNAANAILRRFRAGELERRDPREEQFLGVIPHDELAPHLDKVFGKPSGKSQRAGLDELYEEGGADAFEDERAVRRAIYQARFRLVRALMPQISLLIVDEAHKLKNANTVRARAVRIAFRRRFDKALFLTATPFQLAIGELRQIFALFGNAKGAPSSLKADADQLFADIGEYQAAYDDFQRTWAGIDHAAAVLLREHLASDPALERPLDDPSLAAVVQRYRALLDSKEQRIEPGLRRWMIRSLKEDKRIYRRREKTNLLPRGGDALPFLVYERLIAELFRVKSPTHKAAVQINMVSSYGAAREGALLSSEERSREKPTVEAYRMLLREVMDRLHDQASQHPKLGHVAEQALAAADAGDKTLVFCARIETLRELARELSQTWEERILRRWQALYSGASEEDIFDRRDDEKRKKGRHALLQQRFHSPQDVLYLALRERYVQSLLHLHDWPLGHLDAIAQEANQALRRARTGLTAATRIDYRLAKRCVEQATARIWQRLAPDAASDYQEIIDRLCDERFVAYGYDLEPDALEGDEIGEHTPSWQITRSVAELVVRPRPHLWGALASRIFSMPERTRIDVVEHLARYLTFRQVPFLIDVLEAARAQGSSLDPIESRPLLDFIDSYWVTPAGRLWVERLAAFLDYYTGAPESLRPELLVAVERAAFVRHTRDGESREKLREAFNTPLFPMVLIANEVMQEGLDLHRSCRRVVHHDLAWNPAQLEQRVGRVDRLGSLTAKLRAKDPTATLDILYPLIRNTIDDRLYRTVHAREKWLEFLLGARPNFEEYWFGDEEPPPLPDSMAERLRVDLGPRDAGSQGSKRNPASG